MPIYREENGKLKKVDAVPVLKEKELQILVENNLEEVLEMYFLATEFVTTLGGRIDTLAVDTLGAPVIIEYKRNRNDNVINQALSYLKWLKAQKEEFFEMLILKKLGSERAKSLRIDWKNPRVICIAENFNKYDLDTVEVVPIRIELYKYRLYENGIFTLDPQHVLDQKSQPTVEIKTSGTSTLPSLDDHLAKASEETKELFLELRSRILELDENVQ